MDQVTRKLAKIVSKKTRGAMTGSKAQWYEFGEKNNTYFYNLEKINHKKKHITSLTKEDGNIVHQPKQILQEEERFFKEIYQSKNVCVINQAKRIVDLHTLIITKKNRTRMN